MQVELPEELASEVKRVAAKSGLDDEVFVIRAVKESLLSMAGETALARCRAAFANSSLSEDEAVELFEAEKHAMRSERRESAS
jgi:hypothetical protein